MGFLGGLFGSNKGLGFEAQSAPIIDPRTGQAEVAGNATQGTIDQQQALVNALAAQNGIGNQSQVFNQLGGIAQGQGPNPAQAMLNQSTGQNIAQQAALMASQRGASANSGLIARQAAKQGSDIQQQAAGQGATLQAQQSLNALGQQGQIAGQQVGNQIGAAQGLTNAQAQQFGQLLGANNAYNQANVANTSQMNSANAGIANTAAQGQENLIGKIMGGAGSAASLPGGGAGAAGAVPPVPVGAHGGIVQHYDSGGTIRPPFQSNVTSPSVTFDTSYHPSSFASSNALADGFDSGRKIDFKSMFGPSPETQAKAPLDTLNSFNTAQGIGSAPQLGEQPHYAKGGRVPALLSPQERYLPPAEVKKVEQGKKSPIKAGEKIPGKAVVSGDSLKNDFVPKTLTEGGVVLPRSVTQAKNPGKAAQQFIDALMKKQGKKS